MLHPRLGVVIFNFFDYTVQDLKGVTASIANTEDKNVDLKPSASKEWIELLFDETFHTQVSAVHSILICTQLSEEEFDTLDESFHILIPKSLTLFKNNIDESYQDVILHNLDKGTLYDIHKVKQALFAEFLLPSSKELMSKEQQRLVHLDIKDKFLIQGLPGSGKSSLLVAKALYEKMKRPKLKLIIFAERSCNVHQLQALIFKFIENSHWAMNPADITVSNFESIKRRSRQKDKYDFVVCDNINEKDIVFLNSLLSKKGRLLASSAYLLEGFEHHSLNESFRLPAALCAACEGIKVERLEDSLSFRNGNIFMNTILILTELIKENPVDKISIIHHNKEESLQLKTEINAYFTQVSYLYDEPEKQKGILIYPLSHIGCITNEYVLIILDDNSHYDSIELISRAHKKSFILSQSIQAEYILNQIKGHTNEID